MKLIENWFKGQQVLVSTWKTYVPYGRREYTEGSGLLRTCSEYINFSLLRLGRKTHAENILRTFVSVRIFIGDTWEYVRVHKVLSAQVWHRKLRTHVLGACYCSCWEYNENIVILIIW